MKETTAYNHTFTLQQGNSHQSLGITVDDPLTGQDLEFRLAMLNSLSIEVALGEIVKYASSFVSRPGRMYQGVLPIRRKINLPPQWRGLK